jgi:trypsin
LQYTNTNNTTVATKIIMSPSSSFPISRSLIVGGSEVSTADNDDYAWPTYASAFAWSGIGTIGWGCGGALIHDDIILTGAHCQWVYHVGGDAWIGAHYIKENSSHYYRTVSQVVIHPNYTDQKQVYNDIMLVKINGTGVVNATTEFYDYNTDPNVPTNGAYVRVVGFGKTTEGGNISETLRQVNVQYVDSETCTSTWSQYDSHLHLCAGTKEGGKDSCDSDSGSPLFVVQQGHSRPIVVGLVGDGIGCGRAMIPALYTRVSTFSDWIRQSVCEISSNPPLTCDSGGGSDGDDVFTTTAGAWSGWSAAASDSSSSTKSVVVHVPIVSISSFATFLASMIAVMAIIKLSVHGHNRWNSHRRRQGYQTVVSNNNENDKTIRILPL